MSERSIQVTYRKGRPLAAYLHLVQGAGMRSARIEASADGLLVVDFDAAGKPLGVEITAPAVVTLARLNALLESLRQPPLSEEDFKPIRTA
jgi:hypothetical protein